MSTHPTSATPTATASSNASSPPPVVTRFAYPDGERLRVFFTRDPARNDVTIEVRDTVDIFPAATSRCLRVKITH